MSFVNPNPFTTRPEIDGTFGVVASTHWIATAVGMGDARAGGNAFDAAVATAFTLQVVEPHLNGPGGDVPVIVYDVRRGKPEVICGQGPAPAGATIAHYRGLGLDLVPGTGLLAACVPGTFDTWMMLLRDYGTHAARRRAGAGDRLCAQRLSAGRARLRHHRARSRSCSASIGRPRPPSICRTARCRRRARCSPTRRSPTPTSASCARPSAGGDRERADRARAQDVVAGLRRRGDRPVLPHAGGHGRQRPAATAACSPATTWRAGRPTVEAPITYDYGRYTVLQGRRLEPGPGDAAAARAAQGLRPRRPRPGRPGFHPSAGRVRQARLADRDTFYGDPKFVDVPIETLLSDAYNAERRKLDRRRASLELRPGIDRGLRQRSCPCRRARRGAGAGEPTVGACRTAPASRRSAETLGDGARRHRAFRHHRPRRQHGLGDAVGRLAAVLAGHPRARLLPRHARPDVLARGGPSGRARARQAPAHDAVADAGAARRRAVSRLGLARRRPAGPVDHAVLPAPRPRRA